MILQEMTFTDPYPSEHKCSITFKKLQYEIQERIKNNVLGQSEIYHRNARLIYHLKPISATQYINR